MIPLQAAETALQPEPGLTVGRYRARVSDDPQVIEAAQNLRHLAFFGLPGGDVDSLDQHSRHLLITDRATGQALACCRLFDVADAMALQKCYAARSYDLSRLAGFAAPMLELGRFCTLPGLGDADVLRLAWAMIARHVDAQGVGLMFGCGSLPGAEPARHVSTLTHLWRQHPAPAIWRPGPKATARVSLRELPIADTNQSAMPALMRTYLTMGAWVSDHAVIDRELNTMHVFTGVEITRIPRVRKRALRALATLGA